MLAHRVARISILTFLEVLRGQGQTTFIFNFFQSVLMLIRHPLHISRANDQVYYNCTCFLSFLHIIMYFEQSQSAFSSRTSSSCIRVLFNFYYTGFSFQKQHTRTLIGPIPSEILTRTSRDFDLEHNRNQSTKLKCYSTGPQS